MDPSHRSAAAPAHRGSVALDGLGFGALAALAWMNLRRFDWNWDTLAYHMPFAAFRAGLLKPLVFQMRADLQARLLGFPPLADWVQGMLWRLTGRPEATELVSPIALVALAGYLRWGLGMPALWPVAVAVAIPITHTTLDSANIDLWTNAFFCLYGLAMVTALRVPSRLAPLHAGLGLVALAVAANSKPQFCVLAAAALWVQGCATLAMLWRDRNPAARRLRGVCLLMSLAMAPLVMLTPLRNAIRFGNPLYPDRITLAGFTLPGPEANVWTGPDRLAGVPGPVRYALSQLDFDAINSRPGGFTQDQAGAHTGADGDRMGGSLSVLLLGSLGALAIGLWRRRLRAVDWICLGAAAAMTGIVAAFPGSSELRYFPFVNILASVAALGVLSAAARAGDAYGAGLLAGLRLLVIGAACFTSFATGLRHVGMVDARTLDGILAQGYRAQLAAALTLGDVLCYTRPDSDAFFFTPALDPGLSKRPYKVMVLDDPAACPPGSVVIR